MDFDSVQIGAADLAQAAREYELLLGMSPNPLATGALRFQLRHGAVEIELGEAGLHAMRFAAASDAAAQWPADSFHGLCVRFGPVPHLPHAVAADPAAAEAIDHVVVHSPNLDRAIALWRDRLGLRLALDREFPKRGLRMLFFRSGGVTLEFTGPIPAPAGASGPDGFYGIAYRVRDLEACRARLLRARVDVSGVRPGQKAGTTVASVRSGTAGVPTLLIEDPSRAA